MAEYNTPESETKTRKYSAAVTPTLCKYSIFIHDNNVKQILKK